MEFDTLLPKKRRVLETLTFLAANPAIACSICEQGGVALLLQVVAGPHEGVQLEAAETLQALMTHSCAQVIPTLPCFTLILQARQPAHLYYLKVCQRCGRRCACLSFHTKPLPT